jgi:4-hydroxythreonine-4-phosphate dehydrogenase
MTRRPCIAITLGDPCGIGPELLLSSLAAINAWAEVLVIGARAGVELLETGTGAPKVAWRWGAAAREGAQAVAGLEVNGLWTRPLEGTAGEEGYATWLDPTPEITAADLQLGQGSALSGRCAVEAVRMGAELVQSGQADALVTLPLAKSAAHLAGYAIPGHTEFLQELAGSPITRMAFVSPSLSVVLHTVHQSLRSVVEELSVDAVAETLAFAAERFMQLTGKLDLKVGLCALNPHAGENGAFGQEEAMLDEALVQAEASFMAFDRSGSPMPFAHVPSPFGLGPAPAGWSIFPGRRTELALMGSRRDIEIVEHRLAGPPTKPAPQFFGPLASDTLFLRAARGEFDLVVALYHDQGLIPLKVLEPDRAVNLTLGLPYIRTSPDHGTAFDRAGHWSSSAVNFMEATALAIRLAGRAKHEPWAAEV